MSLPPRSQDIALDLLRDMVRIRRLEERAGELYGEGKIRGFLHLYIGEEAVAVGVLHALAANDAVVATYREHGHALIKGVPMKAIMAEMYGHQEGCSRGRGGSMHLFDATTRFFGGNAIVAGGLPLTVGLALAERMQGGARLSACFFGEGAMAEGAFHESINLAALWQLPMLFCCENNLYAMGTALDRSQSQTDLCVKASAYKVDTRSVDGMDVIAVYDAARDAVEHIRAGRGPFFLEFRTYRFRAHSMFDPQLYRDKDEVEQWKTHGPIHTYSAQLKAEGLLDEPGFLAILNQVDAEVEAAVTYAESGSLEPLEDLSRDVYTPRAAP
ncbi:MULTISPECIES: pyruvate dehydrogenase (acetyl-transferring) E1 component subunit alpha [Pseudomonas]|uniref:Pyruvate dehydrogenase E1 component subunit alpha n=1 Tax=Pseudomonas fluorescens TaxID=294 RepID=A0A5E7J5C4_PSEFL|nr:MULTISPECIES: pyruvate dehydrogenase (acetyl-transferring) E1 component subunit alpha [Pseudomonas]MBA4362494.1 pyruvate dehydrogenase (acetyl-transferring) E1 component subunit alpha [Pseudomonas sp.]PMV89535.1 pyruvate dehydrogenase (acetyl-transferring) E1 component subunit alpha [Pseudomonas sp. GW101-1A09]PMV99498.1 pyruvate dehydrogenase (acetyl-transferring) E1 component subunit alpha [Pseudomonas sp. FW306-2-2C-B10A]PMV99886.1 pyruvate dehydrogenase (acetyl-transferring) E1 component